jgi:hypothetical protein
MPAPWETEAIIRHSQRLLQSFHHYLGRPLFAQGVAADAAFQARQLFEAPCIVVSHGTEDEPIFNYGNAQALALWGLTWDELIRFPSRQTAQGADQPERARMLAQAKAQGYFEGYVGDRATASGKRFRMENGLIWTVVDETGAYCGQAATFSQYHFLESTDSP